MLLAKNHKDAFEFVAVMYKIKLFFLFTGHNVHIYIVYPFTAEAVKTCEDKEPRWLIPMCFSFE